jgi:hypothetical protein
MYSQDQIALLRAIEEIKAAWVCEEHGTCFISQDSKHIQMNRFRLSAWGAAIVSFFLAGIGTCLLMQYYKGRSEVYRISATSCRPSSDMGCTIHCRH